MDFGENGNREIWESGGRGIRKKEKLERVRYGKRKIGEKGK